MFLLTVVLGTLVQTLVAVGVLAAGLSLLQGVLMARLNAVLVADVREDLMARLLRQPPSYHQHAAPGADTGTTHARYS
jgi:ABC-type bacteriocin/lantibiotic exporter with double-glycine peptidase domain